LTRFCYLVRILCLLIWLPIAPWGTTPSFGEIPALASWHPTVAFKTDKQATFFLPARQGSAKASRYPVVIRDLRTWSSQESTRLVLDLNRPVTFTESQLRNPERVVVEIANTILGKPARERISGGTLPQPFQISQSHPRVVAITLLSVQVARYKVFTLSNPDRLVVDVARQPHSQIKQIGETAVSPMPPVTTLPTAPSIPSPTVTEPAKPLVPKGASQVRTIVIDPGHGGKDPGTVGRHGTTEKEVTLKVAVLLRDMLGKLPNTRVLMTRERDAFIELEDRAKFANAKNADLFVSIHVNSHPHKGVRGLEIYHFGEAKDQRALEVAARENGTPLNSTAVGWEYLVADLLTSKKIEDSLELAWTAKQAMVTRLNGNYSTIDHGVKTAPFYVLRFTTMPSILAEIAFMSNPIEEEQMRTPAFLAHVAESIFDGVKAYLQPHQSNGR
jgi:N-acetylmuramoyl-L-alanine amidase